MARLRSSRGGRGTVVLHVLGREEFRELYRRNGAEFPYPSLMHLLTAEEREWVEDVVAGRRREQGSALQVVARWWGPIDERQQWGIDGPIDDEDELHVVRLMDEGA